MSSYPATEPVPRESAREADVVHAWRVSQLIRLGLAWPVAEALADKWSGTMAPSSYGGGARHHWQ